jgi:predicted Ser/Thr protein kinase
VPGYEVLGELGRGGMGVVYRARQARLGRTVALKVLLAGAHAGEQELARFRAEAEAVARLHHPNVVQVYEVGEEGGHPYLALEYVDGGSLADRLRGTPLPAREAARLAEALARAVHAAHEKGIVHRDLKPANVLLTADGTPKVVDFGLAKRLDGATLHTQTGAVLGTPDYMAPEQAEGQAVGPAADIHALGTLLYQMLTGRPPFVAENALDTLLRVRLDEPVPPSVLQPKVPRDLSTVCLKCLPKAPAQRYASARDLADDLRRFLNGEPVRARPVGRAERLWRWCRRNPAVAALLVAVALTLVVGTAVSTVLAVAADARGRYADEMQRLRGLADDKAQEALEQRARAEKAELLARRRLYLSDMRVAERAWQDRLLPVMQNVLDRHGEGSVEQDMRGFEWYYLARLPLYPEQVVLRGHTKAVTGAVFSPDGLRIASAGGDGSVKVWDAATGLLRLTLPGHPWGILDVAFSPDGKQLASAGRDGTVKVWDSTTGRPERTLRGPARAVTGVAFTPDGGRLVSVSQGVVTEKGQFVAGGGIRAWDLASGREVLSVWPGTPDKSGASSSTATASGWPRPART